MRRTGTIVDEQTGQGIPGATVALWSRGVRIAAVAANDSGEFTIDAFSTPDALIASSIGYYETQWPMPDYDEQSTFELQRNEKQLEEVVIESTRKKPFNWAWLAIAGALVFIFAKDRD